MTQILSAETIRATLASVRKDPVQLALLLMQIAPAHAKSYALSMHQRASWDPDFTEAEHWAAVMTELARWENPDLPVDASGSYH